MQITGPSLAVVVLRNKARLIKRLKRKCSLVLHVHVDVAPTDLLKQYMNTLRTLTKNT